jgi:hypothetical protein
MYTLLMFCIILILLLSGIGYEANSPVVHPTRYTWDPSTTKFRIPVLSSDSEDSPWTRCVFTAFSIYIRIKHFSLNENVLQNFPHYIFWYSFKTLLNVSIFSGYFDFFYICVFGEDRKIS